MLQYLLQHLREFSSIADGHFFSTLIHQFLLPVLILCDCEDCPLLIMVYLIISLLPTLDIFLSLLLHKIVSII